jgi:hypothetical protein
LQKVIKGRANLMKTLLGKARGVATRTWASHR